VSKASAAEETAIPSTPILVTNTNDSGPGSLRQAIFDANAIASPDTIQFDIFGIGVQTIQPITPFPIITRPVLIDTLTQTNASCTSWPATLKIELNGSILGASQILNEFSPDVIISGLKISGKTSTVRKLIINNFPGNGIELLRSNNYIDCNYIATDSLGINDQGYGLDGIAIIDSSINSIGVNNPNLISGNGRHGISKTNSGSSSTYNVLKKNKIGLSNTGGYFIANDGAEISILNGSYTEIDGTALDAANTIAHNSGEGL
jgi:hypothetical protein